MVSSYAASKDGSKVERGHEKVFEIGQLLYDFEHLEHRL